MKRAGEAGATRIGAARRRQRGFSLVELIMFIVIVGVALAGVLTVLNITAKASADPMLRKQALAVAEAMLEEVLSKDYENDPDDAANASATLGCTPATTPSCRPNVVADRPNYNDIDDYGGWSQNAVYTVEGLAAPVIGSYAVSVAVTPLTLGGESGKEIAVSVVTPGETIVLAGFRTRPE